VSSLTPGSLILRFAICVGVTWIGVTLTGLIGYPLTAPVWGMAFARPLLEFFPALGRWIHWHAYHEWEGKAYRYNRTHLRVYFDGDNPWFVAKDVLSVLGKTPETWRDARFAPAEYGVIPGRDEHGFSPAGVLKLTHLSGHPEAAKFRLWFERAVVFTLNRKKEWRDAHGSP
jgi:hypothetical protein